MIGIDALLLFTLVFKFVLLFTSRSSVYLFATEERFLVFPFVSLLLLAVYVMASLFRRGARSAMTRFFVVIFLGIFLIGSLLGIQVMVRKQTQPYLFIHDGGVQTEDAIAALRNGENPYTINYSQRTLGAFPDGFSEATRPNPAWTHYIYLPLQLVFGVPFAMVSEWLFGWFDIRFLYVFSFLVFVVSAVLLQQAWERRIIVLIFGLFNPLFVQFFVSGFNDVFFLGWVALGALLLQRKRYILAALFFGAAFASKQSSWFLIPFYVGFLYAVAEPGERLRTVFRRAVVSLVVAVMIILPFFAWAPNDFIDDTIRYATGSADLSFPISGFGLGQLLVSAGIIHSQWDYYPFWIFQVILGVPLLYLLLRWLRRQPSVSRMLAAYGIFSFAMWLVSRFFNDSYIGVLSVIFLLSYAASNSAATDRRAHETDS